MKIIVFGGAGDMGGEAARDLAAQSEVKNLVIADYNERKAEKIAKELGDKVTSVFVDANEHEEVVKLMKGADAVLSCIGPFYKFEERMVRAAIDAKTPYVSICDDFDAAEEALALTGDAKKAGIPALTGLGWTPGISNVLARKAIDAMDTARRVNIAWAGSMDDSEGLAVIKHTLHIFNGKVPTYQDGQWKKVRAGSGKEVVEFPAPIGAVPVYHLGHPEPVTLPHFVSGLDEVTLKGGITPVWVNDLTVFMARTGMIRTASRRDVVGAFFHKTDPLLKKLGGGAPISGLRVDVYGEKKGKQAHYTYTVADKMRRLTGLPAAIGVLMAARGEIKEKGVIAPEVCIKPGDFIRELIKRDVKINVNEKSGG